MRSSILSRGLVALAVSACFSALPFAAVAADASPPVDVGQQVPDAGAIKEGLFPEDACKELEASGFKCMGFKPAIRYSLPASSFRVGLADVPDMLKKQLDVFADVLRAKAGSGRQVRVIGHADASGAADANLQLSLRRAESVKSYLVQKGADPQMLIAVGQGSKELKNPSEPNSAENRRVEGVEGGLWDGIGRRVFRHAWPSAGGAPSAGTTLGSFAAPSCPTPGLDLRSAFSFAFSSFFFFLANSRWRFSNE